MCSEKCPETLSKDLGQKDLVQNVENSSHDNTSMLQSSPDFEFIVGSSLEHEPSSADELFSNGVIIPTQAREGSVLPQYVNRYHPKVHVASSPPRPPILYHSPAEISKKLSKEGIVSSSTADDKSKSNISGWFSRSSSLKGEAKKGLLCSLSLPRSNSVGSGPNQKKTMSKDKQNSQRKSPLSFTKSSSCSSTSNSSSNHSTSQKPPSKKNHVMKYGNGVQPSPSPVLNMPSSYIGIGASSLFGFGRLLPGRKDQKNCRS